MGWMFNFFVRRKLPKETIVEFDKLEGHPSLPTAAAAAAAASAANNPNSQQSQVCDLSRFLQCHSRFFPLTSASKVNINENENSVFLRLFWARESTWCSFCLDWLDFLFSVFPKICGGFSRLIEFLFLNIKEFLEETEVKIAHLIDDSSNKWCPLSSRSRPRQQRRQLRPRPRQSRVKCQLSQLCRRGDLRRVVRRRDWRHRCQRQLPRQRG